MQNEINGMPIDNRIRPVYVFTGSGCNIRRIVVVSDGKGNAYDCGNDLYKGCDESVVNYKNLIDSTTIRFERGISGQEF